MCLRTAKHHSTFHKISQKSKLFSLCAKKNRAMQKDILWINTTFKPLNMMMPRFFLFEKIFAQNREYFAIYLFIFDFVRVLQTIHNKQ